MIKKSNFAPVEPPSSEILNENNPVVDDSDDLSVSEEMVLPEDVPSPKKKRISRKKTPHAAGSTEVKAKKSAPKRPRSTKIDKSESSLNAPVMKAFWGVFNPMMVQVAQYSYADEAEARKAAADMTEKKKAPHFVQLVKKVL